MASVAPGKPAAWELPSKPGVLALQADLLSSAEVPGYQKVPFILCGYRPPPSGAWGLLRTVFALHNETGNMWTHLAGFLYFGSLALRACLEPEALGSAEAAEGPLWVLALLLATAFCMLCSFGYHLCSCTDGGMHQCMYKVDLTGIAVLIAASYFTGIGLAYRCYPNLRRFYLLYSGGVALALVGALLRPQLVSDMPRHLIACCVVGVVPAAHLMCIATSEDVATVVPYLAAMFSFYGAGAAFFVARWPERQWPGRFDLVGHSHQLWHVFVLLAAASWVRGSFAMMRHFGKLEC